MKRQRRTEGGEAPRGQGATTENIGQYLRKEQRSPRGCIAGGMQLAFHHGRLGQVKSLVLFDLDGTLVDTTELILQSFAHAFEAHLPGRLPTRADLISTFGRSLPAALVELAILNGAADPERLADEMLATYRDFQRVHHDMLIQSFEGIAPMLDQLGARGYRLGVVTSKMQHFARRGMRLFDLERHFDVAVFHDDVTRHKPDPAPLIEAALRAKVEPRDAVYVGDSTHDVVAGRAAGMTTVAVMWGPFEREVLEAVTPDHIVITPDDLLRLLP